MLSKTSILLRYGHIAHRLAFGHVKYFPFQEVKFTYQSLRLNRMDKSQLRSISTNINNKHKTDANNNDKGFKDEEKREESFFQYCLKRSSAAMKKFIKRILIVSILSIGPIVFINQELISLGIVTGRSMQPTLNPDENKSSRDVVLLQKLYCNKLASAPLLNPIESAFEATKRDNIIRAILDPFEGMKITNDIDNFDTIDYSHLNDFNHTTEMNQINLNKFKDDHLDNLSNLEFNKVHKKQSSIIDKIIRRSNNSNNNSEEKETPRARVIIPVQYIFDKQGRLNEPKNITRPVKYDINNKTIEESSSIIDSLSIKPGDVVMITSPNSPNMTFVKRVCAIGGQYVHPRILNIEGTPPILKDLNLKRNIDNETLIEIPRNHIWVESDDPYHGLDSNYFGPISIGLIQGKVISVIWPLNRLASSVYSKKSSM